MSPRKKMQYKQDKESMESESSPNEVYQQRLKHHLDKAEGNDKSDSTIADLRLFLFLLGGALITAWVYGYIKSPYWVVPPVLGFAVLVLWHDRIQRSAQIIKLSIEYYRQGLRRLSGEWAGSGSEGSQYLSEGHLYARDLDLFGHGSLFQLLSIARTAIGEHTLAQWLLAPAMDDVIKERHVAIQELASELDYREQIAVKSGAIKGQLDKTTLVAWGRQQNLFPYLAKIPYLVAVLVGMQCIAGGLWLTGITNGLPCLFILLLQWVISHQYADQLATLMTALRKPQRELDLLATLLEHFESHRFSSPLLSRQQRLLVYGGESAAVAISRLRVLIDRIEMANNQFFTPIAFVLMWRLLWSAKVEGWRLQHGPHMSQWLDALGELEALNCLAGYHYENPESVFPEVLLLADAASLNFDAVQIKHPLLPRHLCVANDLKLDAEQQLFLISGSNMSGKSTLLRTVGSNIVLALCGAPVCAQSLRLSPVQLGATMRVEDSIQAGRSRFYAELERLYAITQVAKGAVSAVQPPLFFLLDEVFHGTNSHDRQIGASALIKNLLHVGASGLVTTHDLALTDLANTLGPKARNVHFSDTLKEGQLHFDYHMHEGVVQHSNAIHLMRAMGFDLDVET